MNLKLLCLSMLLTFTVSAQASGKIVIYIQDLLNKNSSGMQALEKAAAKRNVVLEWESYVSSNIFKSERINNPSPAAGVVDFVIVEQETGVTKGEWKQYSIQKYVLKDARSGLPLKYSKVLRSEYQGGCKPNGMCVQVMTNDKKMGTSRTSELEDLIDYALTLEKSLL